MLDSLNPAQRRAVTHTETPLFVLAGAGSGKTRVIVEKIVYLIEHCKIKPQHIFAITFTNKAAREMRARVSERMPDAAKSTQITTFHTLGLNILRKEYRALERPARFSIFDSDDVINLLKELTGLDDKKRLMDIQMTIGRFKDQLLTPKEAMQKASTSDDVLAAKAYVQYQEKMRAFNAYDFDDLIYEPTQLLLENETVRTRWQERIRYLLIDEYQDTSLSQYTLMKQLLQVGRPFVVVGDDDQSVYAWRGANPENLKLLQHDFPLLEVVKLEQNYRCSQAVLKAANAVIANNPHLFEKTLWSDLSSDTPVRVVSADDQEKEAELIAGRIQYAKQTKSCRYSQFAILYRSNHQARVYEQALLTQNIPYQVSGGTAFFDRREIKDAMAYLRLISNDDDDQAFLRIINVPKRGLGAKTVATLADYAAKRGVSLFTASTELGLKSLLKDNAYETLQQFIELIQRCQIEAERGEVSEIPRDLFKNIQYKAWLEEQAPHPKQAEFQCRQVDYLIEWLDRLFEQYEDTDYETSKDTFSKVIQRLMLQDMLNREEDEQTDNKVQLMTAHAAKGLEFDYVFLGGLEEGTFPHHNNLEEPNVFEERRLMYVAMTRAKKGLTISYSEEKKRYGKVEQLSPSRFLEELPRDQIDWETERAVKKEKAREVGKSTLKNLRAQLN